MKSLNEFPTSDDYKRYLKVHFAGLAMQGLLSNTQVISGGSFDFESSGAKEKISRLSIIMANELIKQLQS